MDEPGGPCAGYRQQACTMLLILGISESSAPQQREKDWQGLEQGAAGQGHKILVAGESLRAQLGDMVMVANAMPCFFWFLVLIFKWLTGLGDSAKQQQWECVV